MKINYKTLLASIGDENSTYRCKDRDMLCKTVMSTISNAFKQGMPATDDYDIKVMINGIECEPELLQKLFEGVDEYIEGEAKALYKKKYEAKFGPLDDKLYELSEAFEDMKQSILDKA